MNEHAGNIAKWLETGVYGIGGTVTLGGIVGFIDQHNWIVSAAGMVLMFIGSMFFKYLHYRLQVKIVTAKLDNDE